MGLIIKDNKLLFKNGELATSLDCCCESTLCPCTQAPAEQYTIVVSGIVEPPGNFDSYFNGTYVVTKGVASQPPVGYRCIWGMTEIVRVQFNPGAFIWIQRHVSLIMEWDGTRSLFMVNISMTDYPAFYVSGTMQWSVSFTGVPKMSICNSTNILPNTYKAGNGGVESNDASVATVTPLP